MDRHPVLIANCSSASDVAAAVRAAREIGVALSVRGGGHQVAGLSVCDGLVVDLGGLRTVDADPARRRGWAGGGCLLGDVDAGTQRHGLIAPAGVISHTGLGGLALGGGVGWTCRHFGLTCDNIVGAELVTADGDVLRVDERTDPELLWALRGGGGNFGVVTTFEFALHEVSDVLFGQAVFPLAAAGRATAHYVEVMAAAPAELTAVLVLRPAPPLPAVPPELVGWPVVVVNAVWSGAPERGEAAVRRLVHGAGPTAARVTRLPYLQLQTMQDDLHPHGLSNHMKSRYLSRLDAGAADALVGAAEAVPGPTRRSRCCAWAARSPTSTGTPPRSPGAMPRTSSTSLPPGGTPPTATRTCAGPAARTTRSTRRAPTPGTSTSSATSRTGWSASTRADARPVAAGQGTDRRGERVPRQRPGRPRRSRRTELTSARPNSLLFTW